MAGARRSPGRARSCGPTWWRAAIPCPPRRASPPSSSSASSTCSPCSLLFGALPLRAAHARAQTQRPAHGRREGGGGARRPLGSLVDPRCSSFAFHARAEQAHGALRPRAPRLPGLARRARARASCAPSATGSRSSRPRSPHLARHRRPVVPGLALDRPRRSGSTTGPSASLLPFHATFLIIAFLTVGVAIPTPGMVGGFHAFFILALAEVFGVSTERGGRRPPSPATPSPTCRCSSSASCSSAAKA